MNTTLLKQVRRRILKEPRQFDMDSWFQSGTDLNWKVPNCGTAACIGGWAIALKRKVNPRKASCGMGDRGSHASSKALQLTEWQAVRLFHVVNWPDRFRKTYEAAETPLGRARIAARRIDHFIKTKGEA